jgi:hypothetical protein
LAFDLHSFFLGGNQGQTKQTIPTLAQYEACESNAKAYNLMLMSCIMKISYGLVEEAEGSAFDALYALNNKWAPTEQEDLTDLQKKEFTKC